MVQPSTCKRTKILFNKVIIILQRHKWVVMGLVGVVLAFTGGAGLRATTIPWLLSADAPFHLDYAWQVYQGGLPAAMEGVKMPVNRAFHSIHLAAQHPPLYYTVLSPLAGPFLANGEWQMATAFGRLLSFTFGLLSVLSLAWLAWVVGGSYKYILAVAAPAIAATFALFIGTSSAVYNDTLVVLMSTLALVLSILILKKGPRLLYLGSLTLILLLGMAAKVSFVGAFFLALLLVFTAFIIHGKDKLSKNAIKGAGCVVAMVLVAAAGIGWFYYFHNFETSGSLTSARPVEATTNRSYKPFTDVITSSNLWSLIPFRLFGRSFYQIGDYTLNHWASLAVSVLGMGGSVIWFIKEKMWHFLNKTHKISLIIAVVLAAHLGIIFAQQVVHATGYGAYNPRYLLPAWGVMGLVFAFGISVWPRLRGVGVVLASMTGWATVVGWTVYNLSRRTNMSTDEGWLHLLQTGAEQNGFPSVIVPVFLAAITLGTAFVGVALWHLTKQTNIPPATGFNEGQTDTTKAG